MNARPIAGNPGKGQAVTEYALISTLISVVCIAALMTLGNAISETLHALLPGKKPVMATVASTDIPLPSPNPAVEPPPVEMESSLPSQIVAEGLTFTTSSGTTISLPTYPDKASDVVNAVGANGATDMMSDMISTVAKQLLDSGEITEPEYNDLVALSNQGHQIGSLQKALEDAALQAGSSAEYAKMKVTFNGKTYSPKPLSDSQGFDTNSQDASKVKDALDTRSALGETKKFLKLYDKVKGSSAMSDPAVQTVVTSLVSQIAYLSEASVASTYKAANGDLNPAEIRKQIVSDMTHADSMGICKAGKGKDSGTLCGV